MLIVVGYVVSVSKPMQLLIRKMARLPHSGRGAIVLVATVSLLISLINWAMSTVLTALLVIALAQRKELNMDYRAAAAAAIIGMGPPGHSASVPLLHNYRPIKAACLNRFTI